MARALMTPDELRRMDNDLCIIFVKGLRPIKANKFYYFKKPMARELAKYEINHNDIGDIERGTWRKYNPYNPYVPEDEKKKEVEELKIESLDSLFEDENENKLNENKISEHMEKPIDDKEEFNSDTLFSDFEENKEGINSEVKKKEEPTNNTVDDEYDLQKELEAKFDELFGPIDDDN